MGADVLVPHDIIRGDPESRKLEDGWQGGGSESNLLLSCGNTAAQTVPPVSNLSEHGFSDVEGERKTNRPTFGWKQSVLGTTS